MLVDKQAVEIEDEGDEEAYVDMPAAVRDDTDEDEEDEPAQYRHGRKKPRARESAAHNLAVHDQEGRARAGTQPLRDDRNPHGQASKQMTMDGMARLSRLSLGLKSNPGKLDCEVCKEKLAQLDKLLEPAKRTKSELAMLASYRAAAPGRGSTQTKYQYHRMKQVLMKHALDIHGNYTIHSACLARHLSVHWELLARMRTKPRIFGTHRQSNCPSRQSSHGSSRSRLLYQRTITP